MSKILRFFIFILLPSSFILLFSGCQLIGVIASAVPQTKKAEYVGFAGQSVGVMVWADRAVKIDWNSVQIDAANMIQNSLQQAKSSPEFKGTTWPVQAGSIARYQMDHPGLEAEPITEIAPKFGVTRLIYVEIQHLSTRSDASLQMFRGSVTATVQVVEVNNGVAKVGYQNSNITATFPPKSPPEGVLDSNDVYIYRGTLGALADAIGLKFIGHERDINEQ